jgi:hypothetical protein
LDRLALIYACAQANWWPHLGDPSWSGLGLTALYIVASLLFLRAILTRGGWLPRERLLWVVCTLAVVVLAINKQLDLQQTIVWVGRCVAKQEGWFDQRLVFQRNFGMTVLALITAGILALGWASRAVLKPNWPLILGMALMTGFVMLQVTRFEQLSGDLAKAMVSLKLHRITEGTALCVLIWSALRKRPLLT